MINTAVLDDNLVVVGSDPTDGSGANWMFLCAHELAQIAHSAHVSDDSYDRLLQRALGAVRGEMDLRLALILQAVKMLEEPGLGSMTDRQLDALTALQRQAQALGQMIDGLPYIAAFADR